MQALPTIPASEIQQIVAGTSGTLLGTLPASAKEQALEAIVSAWQKMCVMALSVPTSLHSRADNPWL